MLFLKLPEFTCSPGLAWNPPLLLLQVNPPAVPRGALGPGSCLLEETISCSLSQELQAQVGHTSLALLPWHLAGFVNLTQRFKNIYSPNCFSSRASPDKTKRVVCVQSNARVCKAARSSRLKSMSTHTRYQTPTHAEIMLLKNNELPIVSSAMEQG